MPRIGTLSFPGGLIHIIGRAIDRRQIFSADVDKRDFLIRLGNGLRSGEDNC